MARGGVRPGGGRPKGARNKATAEIKELARAYVPEGIKELARLMKEAESEAARVAAIKEMFDRAYGKSPQAITGEDGKAVQVEATVIVTGVRRKADAND